MSTDDSADEPRHLLKTALYVEPLARCIDLNTVPRDGSEFIHKSRLETANLLFNELEKEQKQMKQLARKEAVEFSYYASALARDKALLKKKFPRKLKFPNDKPNCIQDWGTFCLGSILCSKIYKETYKKPKTVIEEHLPLLSIVVHFNQYKAFTVLEYLHNWFLSVGMDESIGRWVYAVLACIRRPLDPYCKELIEAFYNDCEKRLKDCDDLKERSQLYLILAIFEYYFHINSD